MPPNAKKVDRSTRWGNPYKVGFATVFLHIETAEEAVRLFREYAEARTEDEPGWLEPLRGKDLACWCKITDDKGNRVPCHADILLELANRGYQDESN